MQIIYHGHSFVEIERENSSILIDPFVSHNPRCDISLDDVLAKPITHMLLTHVREDSVNDIIAIMKQTWCTLIALKGMCEWLQSKWMIWGEIISQPLYSVYNVDDGSVEFIRSVCDTDTTLTGRSSGLIVSFDNCRIYHAGDSALYSDMDTIKNIDLALLPIGGTYTMGVEDAVQACGLIKPKLVVPIHYNTWSKIKADDIEFAREVMLAQYAVPKVLRAGQYIVL